VRHEVRGELWLEVQPEQRAEARIGLEEVQAARVGDAGRRAAAGRGG
jgi:hypothetical protein